MYICTFYSFKGGVGRTMALVNVAAELAKRGKRILIVDFDIEAPGISTFDEFSCKQGAMGIVDYITDYLENNQAPLAKDYITKCGQVAPEAGEIFLMGSGRQDSEYETRLHQINWQTLYERREGYLLFEDLKAQWKEQIKPDYVLIDSRTGHTDIGGICTRQLPDAVAVMFFPNRQNLTGLRKVVGDIRNERLRERSRHGSKVIQIHFAVSNIPDIDDEDNVLGKMLEEFRSSLKIEKISAEIHHYDSLNLLEQQVFVLRREKTRLAKEYVNFANAIVEKNAEDRDGAIKFLDRTLRLSQSMRRSKEDTSITEIEDHLDRIETYHSTDPDILFRLASSKSSLGDFAVAANFLDRAIKHGCKTPEAFAQSIFLHRLDEDKSRVIEDAKTILELPESGYRELTLATRTLAQLEPESVMMLPASPAVHDLGMADRISLGYRLNSNSESMRAVEVLLREAFEISKEEFEERGGRTPHALCLNHLGRFKDTIAMYGGKEKSPDDFDAIADLFNFGMALWGDSGKIPREIFERVLEMGAENSGTPRTANFSQCLAIAAWGVGRNDDAYAYSSKARSLIRDQRSAEFSCWRYLGVDFQEFLRDLDEMEEMFSHDDVRPRIFAKAPSKNAEITT